MKTFSLSFSFIVLMMFPLILSAQSNWPREIPLKSGKIILYQPQADSMKGDHLYSRTAFSITTEKMTNPVYGALWTDARFSTDRESGKCTIFDVQILNVRFPGIDTIDPKKVEDFKSMITQGAKDWKIEFSLDDLKASLDLTKTATGTTAGFKNDPPEIIYVKKPSVLVLFDGDPAWKETGTDGPKRAINTPFLVLQDTRDKNYYLYGGQIWYKSPDVLKGPWINIQKPSSQVQKYYDAMKKEMEKSGKTAQQPPQQSASGNSTTPLSIVVRIKPSELIQSKGDPQYAPIQGTQLLYMTNTDNNVFMTIDNNQYYVLLSGRWYRSASLSGPWTFVDSDKLPADFSKIPEGSPKDIVLASVAGTPAAKDALLDAQIPQTAAVDRKTAKCEVKWDGDPKFEKIKGTELARGMNTSSTVLLYKNTYYVCDNAVWFTGTGPSGPWAVATSVPDEVQKIPPEDPSYNVKYVYIYDVEPDVVYVGYTPGYVGCYIYGPTIVYGTGWLYPPFYGPYFYPRPVTFGFGMCYNPWFGFSMGFYVSFGMFSFGFGPFGFPGGWWGPPLFRPPFAPYYNHYYGPRPPVYRGGGNTININNSRNIYVNRPDNSIRPSQLPSDRTRPGAGGAGTRQNNVFTDKNGNVYRNNNGQWQKNNGKNWESERPSTQGAGAQNRNNFNPQDLNRQSQARDRGTQNGFNRSSAQQSMSRGMGGGQQMGGGGMRRK